MEILTAIYFDQRLLTDNSVVSQAINPDISMNQSSAAATTWYKNSNDRAKAIKYQMTPLGNECNEVWYEEIHRRELTDRGYVRVSSLCKTAVHRQTI